MAGLFETSQHFLPFIHSPPQHNQHSLTPTTFDLDLQHYLLGDTSSPLSTYHLITTHHITHRYYGGQHHLAEP
jgi:hypothetical protein